MQMFTAMHVGWVRGHVMRAARGAAQMSRAPQILNVAIHPSGLCFATSSGDHTIAVFNATAKTPLPAVILCWKRWAKGCFDVDH